MRITEVRGYWLEYTPAEPLRNARGTIDKRTALFVELVCEDGRSGWGETQLAPAAAWAVIESGFAAHVLGASVFDGHRIWRALMKAGGGTAGRLATSALDIALWDLRGRLEGRPVSELLSGRLRERVTAYASGPFMAHGADPHRDLLSLASGYVDEGFVALKPRAGHAPRADAMALERLRALVGPDVALMVDFNRGYSRTAASDFLSRCGPADLAWVEEPLAPDDLEGYAALAYSAQTPIAGGEALTDLHEFHSFLAASALAIVQPDTYLCGGLTGALRVAALAEAYHTPLLPHVFGGIVNLHASLQLASVLPGHRLREGREYPFFEYDRTDNALRTFAGEPPLNADGTVSVPTAPGLGLEFGREHLEPFTRHAWSIAL